MQLPGNNKLTLTDAALMQAVEDAINGAQREGEDYIHVLEIGREGYGYGGYVVTITTDKPTASVVEIRAETA